MEIELKELIIKRYGSLKKFCEVIDMPWTTLDSILKRGVSNSNVSNIIKITHELSIDTESLAYGIIKAKSDIHNSVANNTFQISDFEKKILLAYRDTDDIGKEIIHRTLNLSIENEKGATQTTA